MTNATTDCLASGNS